MHINPNGYSIIVNTSLRSSCSTQPASLLAIDILDDEMVSVVLYIGSNLVNYGSSPISVTKSPKVLNQEPMIWEIQVSYRASVSLVDIHKEILLVTTSLK